MISGSSINDIIAIVPPHLAHVRGFTFPDQVRDRLRGNIGEGFWYAENEMAVRDGFEYSFTQVFPKFHHPFLMT